MSYTASRPTDAFDADLRPQRQGFSTAMFGFNREEVMACIERITVENQGKIHTLEKTIQALQANLNTTLSDNKILISKTREVCQELSREKARAQEAVVQAEQMREQVKLADDAVANYRSRLFTREQQQVVLKSDNQRLKATIESLTATVTEYEQTREAWEAEQTQKRAELDQLLDQARTVYERETRAAKAMLIKPAQNIATSIAALKMQLAQVDEKISTATQDLQRATHNIGTMLAAADAPLEALGAQMEQFPTPVAPAAMPQGQADTLTQKLEETISASADTLADIAAAQAQRIAEAKAAVQSHAAATPRILASEEKTQSDDILAKLNRLLGGK